MNGNSFNNHINNETVNSLEKNQANENKRKENQIKEKSAKEKTKEKTVEIFTDGACSGNPGPGGWAAILKFGGAEKEISGGESQTTNNRMELTAVIESLLCLKYPCTVELYTDSSYVGNGISKGWAESWRNNGWRKADKKPALNADLWEKLLDLCGVHTVNFHWIKGHDGHIENERCDKLAVEQSQKYKQL